MSIIFNKSIQQLTELSHFGRFCQSGSRGHAVRNDLGNLVEVSCAYFALVLRRGISMFFERKFRLLQFRVSRHAMIAISKRQLEHTVVDGMEAGQGDELEFVTHL